MTQNATPIENFNVQLFHRVEGMLVKVETTMENVEACFGVRGYEVIGFEDNTRLRPMLQGCPIFSKLVGPMYGGENTVRYEDQAANDQFSA